MLHDPTPATDKRAAFSAALASGKLLRFPGAFNPLSAMLIARHGFEGVYLSGAAVPADLGLPHSGLTTLTDIAGQAGDIARVTHLPALVDAGAGAAEPMTIARAVRLLEDAGAAGMHIDDQSRPGRCGHPDCRHVTDRETGVRRVKAAVAARRDPGFVIAARTDAAAVTGLADAIDRAKAYADEGADLIYPETVSTEADLERFRAEVDEPLLVSMAEPGLGQLLEGRTLESLGINVVIYPGLLLQLAMAAADGGLAEIAARGTHDRLLGGVPHRRDGYGLLDYLTPNTLDAGLYDLKV
jgi:methylisocitrate lyase